MAVNLETRPGGDTPGHPTSKDIHASSRSSRLNVITGLIGAAIGYLLGYWLGTDIAHNYARVQSTGQNNVAIILGYLFGTVGWLAGLGILNYPLAKITGRYAAEVGHEGGGASRYFKYTLDHKVVGTQYLVGMLIYFFTGGLFALGIRTELLSPTYHIWSPDAYIQIVGEHGTMMMMMMTSVITGSFGNYLVPLMIGSRRMAFPRLEAASFWLTPAAYIILLTSFVFGGFDSGWTGYSPLAIQAKAGQDSYLVAFGLMALSMIIASTNFVATIINLRAPGMRWSRLSAFTWSTFFTSFVMGLAAPVLLLGLFMQGMDRSAATAFFVDAHGGSAYLWENVFWFFGHPEVYILALPGFGVVSEMLPVFARKPLFGYKTAIAGMLGVSVLSFFVWQHHLFVSGMNPDMRPLFMLTTELISIPTGIIYLVAMGTLWKAKLRLTVPMMFVLAMYFNFLIGGISGVFVSDVPADVTEHGQFFVIAHFHYTIMGGLIFAFFGGIYYWLPKMTGIMLDQKLGKIHFWLMFLAFNSTFFPMFIIGDLGQPRRVFEYASKLTSLNQWATISAYVLGISMIVFIWNFLYSTLISKPPAPENPWHSRGLEWMTSSPPPLNNFDRIPIVLSDPYSYGDPSAPPVADLRVGPVPTVAAAGGGQINSGGEV